MVKKDKPQVDLDELVQRDAEDQAFFGEPHVDATTPPPPSVAYYDFYKTNGTKPVVINDQPSLTRQEFAEECDINVLMRRYENQDIGAIMRRAGEPVYYDLTEAPSDLMGFMQLMGDAEKAFMSLSAQVRREFDNDPVAFVDFASDPANLDQMRSWGLAPPAPPAPEGAPPPAQGGQPAAPHSSPLDVTVRTDTKPAESKK